MDQDQLKKLIATHESQMEWAKHMLDNHYHELEERVEETRWLNDYIKHKKIVEELKSKIL